MDKMEIVDTLRQLKKEQNVKYLLHKQVRSSDPLFGNDTYYGNDILLALRKYDEMLFSDDLLEIGVQFPGDLLAILYDDHCEVSYQNGTTIYIFGIPSDVILAKRFIDPLIISKYYTQKDIEADMEEGAYLFMRDYKVIDERKI